MELGAKKALRRSIPTFCGLVLGCFKWDVPVKLFAATRNFKHADSWLFRPPGSVGSCLFEGLGRCLSLGGHLPGSHECRHTDSQIVPP